MSIQGLFADTLGGRVTLDCRFLAYGRECAHRERQVPERRFLVQLQVERAVVGKDPGEDRILRDICTVSGMQGIVR